MISFNPLTSVSFIGTLGLVATGTLLMTTPATAAILGEISISGGRVVTRVIVPGVASTPAQPLDFAVPPVTSFNFANIGSGNPTGTGQFLISYADGLFSSFNPNGTVTRGTILDLDPMGDMTPENFLSFGDIRFDLMSINPGITTPNSDGSGVNISFAVEGIFRDTVAGTSYRGYGTFGAEITFPIAGASNLNQFYTRLQQSGRQFTVQSWSANLVAVPEPLTMLGVGTALGFGAIFKRKLSKKEEN
ncbi:protein of unknown function DUF1555 [Gloeothece citriformis PCC 7424]|uniref:PEP-CTERM protein-sorting domain-containing protein n=1 Tax=Gloeothece citriformis (strain PCC 7424) TaxID=65393 RepID=B7KEJ4_GLOC7|nr:PEP-CTERM sorting domain-containing protein [Gloeothece citriformis]ACK69019.1 protein of unknown function DUF1555 [Gloeothece citriformis PCC 7424]